MYSCKSPTMMQQPELDLATRSRQHGRVAAALPVQVNNPGARIRPRGLKEAMKETRWHKSFRFMLKFSCSSCLRGGLGGGGQGGRAISRSIPQAAEEALALHRKLGDRSGEASSMSIEVWSLTRALLVSSSGLFLLVLDKITGIQRIFHAHLLSVRPRLGQAFAAFAVGNTIDAMFRHLDPYPTHGKVVYNDVLRPRWAELASICARVHGPVVVVLRQHEMTSVDDAFARSLRRQPSIRKTWAVHWCPCARPSGGSGHASQSTV